MKRQEFEGNSEAMAGKTKSQRILMLKGAPEIVFEKCSHILINGNVCNLPLLIPVGNHY